MGLKGKAKKLGRGTSTIVRYKANDKLKKQVTRNLQYEE